MIIQLLSATSLKCLPVDEKDQMPVSIVRHPDGENVVVSWFGEEVWDLYPYVGRANAKASGSMIDWRIQLPDGNLLTAPLHRELLGSAKDYLWSVYIDPVEGRKRPTVSTLQSKVARLVHLLRWMVSRGLRRFSDINGYVADYVSHAKVREDRSAKVSLESMAHRLQVLEDLYHQRNKLNDALAQHPWPEESCGSMAGVNQRRGSRKPKTDFIPDDIAAQLATAAIQYMRERAPNILEAYEQISEGVARATAAGKNRKFRVEVRRTAAVGHGFEGSGELTKELIRLRTAGYILVNLFSGLRDSEMTSLDTDCISHDKSRDGSIDVIWIHGTIYKTGIRAKKWLVPAIVEEAIAMLIRLTAPLRRLLADEESALRAAIANTKGKDRARSMRRLHAVKKYRDKLFLGVYRMGGNAINVPGTHNRNYDLRNFCEHAGIHGADGKRYPLRTHTFRRTYARNVARSELGDLLSLREHFGHWSLDMTMYYADGGADDYEVDTELLEMITNEKGERQKEIVGDLLTTDAPLANGGHWLQEWRSSVRTAKNKESLIAEYADSVSLAGTGHSWCVGNPKGIGCGGLCIFEAQMCVDCNFGIIGPEHRPVWQGIKEQQLEALALDDMGPGGRSRAERIVGKAEKVLRRLDGSRSKD